MRKIFRIAAVGLLAAAAVPSVYQGVFLLTAAVAVLMEAVAERRRVRINLLHPIPVMCAAALAHFLSHPGTRPETLLPVITGVLVFAAFYGTRRALESHRPPDEAGETRPDAAGAAHHGNAEAALWFNLLLGALCVLDILPAAVAGAALAALTPVAAAEFSLKKSIRTSHSPFPPAILLILNGVILLSGGLRFCLAAAGAGVLICLGEETSRARTLTVALLFAAAALFSPGTASFRETIGTAAAHSELARHVLPGGTGLGNLEEGLFGFAASRPATLASLGDLSFTKPVSAIMGLIIETGLIGLIIVGMAMAFGVTLAVGMASRGVENSRPLLAASLVLLILASLSPAEESGFLAALATAAVIGSCLRVETSGHSLDQSGSALLMLCCFLVAMWWGSLGRTRLEVARIRALAASGPDAVLSACTDSDTVRPGVPAAALPSIALAWQSKGQDFLAARTFLSARAGELTPAEMVAAADCFMKTGNREIAMRYLTASFCLSGGDTKQALALSEAYREIGQLEAAMDILECLGKERSTAREILLAKASLREARGQGISAQSLYEEAYEKYGDSALLTRAGTTAYNMKDWGAAMDFFLRSHRAGDSLGTVKYIEAAVKAGDRTRALEFIRSTGGSLANRQNRVKRLVLFLEHEREYELSGELKKAVSANEPEKIVKLRQTVDQLEKAGRFVSAIEIVDNFLEAGGEDSILRLRRADLMVRSGRFLEGAEAYLEAARNLNFRNEGLVTLYRKVAQAFARAKKTTTAIYYCEKALTYSKGRDVELLNDLAKTYGLAGRHGDAERILMEAIRVRPEFYLSYFNLAMSYYERNQIEKAKGAINLGLKNIGNDIATEKLNAFMKHLKGINTRQLPLPGEMTPEAGVTFTSEVIMESPVVPGE